MFLPAFSQLKVTTLPGDHQKRFIQSNVTQRHCGHNSQALGFQANCFLSRPPCMLLFKGYKQSAHRDQYKYVGCTWMRGRDCRLLRTHALLHRHRMSYRKGILGYKYSDIFKRSQEYTFAGKLSVLMLANT